MLFITRDCDQVVLSLRKINLSYYEYAKTGYQEEGFLQMFAGQRNQYSNIQGGYGIWAAYSEAKVDLLK